MHIGRLLCATADPTTVVFTDWMARGADNGVFTVELISTMGCELTVTVFHKNSEDTGPGTSAGAIVTSTSTLGLHRATVSSLKEMVRYKVEVAGADVVGELQGLLYRILPTTWFNTARVS